jgi:glycogen debranching enzyme
MEHVSMLDERFPIIAGQERPAAPLRVLKHGDCFAVFDPRGNIAPGHASEEGVYHDGTRFLSRLELLLYGQRPLLLSSTMSADDAVFEADLTNPDILRDGQIVVARGEVNVCRSRVLGDACCVERIAVTNYRPNRIDVPVSVRFDADFADVFEVRGAQRPRRGKRLEPEIRGDGIRLAYQGLDGVVRRTDLLCTPAPDRVTASEVRFEVRLAPKEEVTIDLQVACEGERRLPRPSPARFGDVYRALDTARRGERARGPGILGSSQRFNRWIERGISDLLMMVSETEHGPYPYAGIPWYCTPFGRDGIITALAALWIDPQIARGVLRFLAATQAERSDDRSDAGPGKIVHELRRGEMAALHEIPFGRYYGTVDATPLYVVLAGAYFERTGDLATLEAIWPSIDRALGWIDEAGGEFLTYARRSENGLVHQGWKDSEVSVFHADGTLATAPIALCEVQGYVYAARRAAAGLARVLGDDRRAARLDAAAERLRIAFEEAFWLDDLGTYALALAGDGRPCRVRTSNAGHCLWAGIAEPARAPRLARTLLDDAMFSGWGIRTVAATEVRYNPLSYHNGSVWPHDNALIAAGLARYGMKDEALRIFAALFDASQYLDLHRMPELLCGFARKRDQGQTLYPVACSPQAWAAVSPLLLLAALLGLELDAPAKQLRLRAPRLPDPLDWLELTDVRLGDASVDLMIRREHDGPPAVDVLEVRGEVDVLVVPG